MHLTLLNPTFNKQALEFLNILVGLPVARISQQDCGVFIVQGTKCVLWPDYTVHDSVKLTKTRPALIKIMPGTS